MRFYLAHCFGLILLVVLQQTHARPQDPELPSISRPVHLTDHRHYERPYIPAYRTTHDGRVGVNFKEGVRIFLFSPEKFGSSVPESPNGPQILSRTNPYVFNKSRLHNSSFGVQGHIGLCEAPNESGEFQNPRVCGNQDCYDLVLITATWSSAARNMRQLWSTPITVRVGNPKTRWAHIASVNIGTPKAGASRFEFAELFEPMFTKDGNLMVGRVAEARFSWQNRANGRRHTGVYDMVYFPAPKDPSRACDIDQWDEMKPIGHAPYDPEINTTYGFAAQPFRDAMGNIISDGVDLGGTYPWIDSEGNNIGFSTFATEWSDNPFPVSCVDQRGCDDTALHPEDPPLMGKTIVGSWTNGKMVLMDGLINNTDFSKVQAEDRGHRMLDLYQASDEHDGKIRIGNGRDNTNDRNGIPSGSPNNTTFLESTENKLNYWPNMRPVTPRDVVWQFSTGAVTEEFAFDDYLFPDAFIISSMVQAVRNNGNRITQYNGIEDARVRIQNGATANRTRWRVPGFGEVLNGRIEPVALGGVHGKGLWLNGNNTSLRYAIEQQPQNIRAESWHVSLFVDPRFANDTTTRTLIAFPDGSELQLLGRRQIVYWKNKVLKRVNLGEPVPQNAWAHIGVQLSNQNRNVELFINGFLANTFFTGARLFELRRGSLWVGASPRKNTQRYKGWIDDFKVIAHRSGKEEWCNHARGTLVGFDHHETHWRSVADLYPISAHQLITDQLELSNRQSFERYACYHDYTHDSAAHLANIPNNLRSIREALNFPEGPIRYKRPRPDSTENDFCLTCHKADGKRGLSLAALEFRQERTAENDPRRQPMQPYKKINGHLPKNWLGRGKPAQAQTAPSGGLDSDSLVLVNPQIKPWNPPWPPITVPERGGQSLLQLTSGMELRANNNNTVQLIYAPQTFNQFDWVLSEASGGWYYIDNPAASKRLRHIPNSSNVDLVDFRFRGTYVQWRLEAHDEQWYYIVNRATGQRLHASRNENYRVRTAPASNSSANVRWQLVDFVRAPQ